MQNPFEYNINEQRTLISFFTQRKAKYKKVAECEFKITENESFTQNIEPPTPPIMSVDGYDSES